VSDASGCASTWQAEAGTQDHSRKKAIPESPYRALPTGRSGDSVGHASESPHPGKRRQSLYL
jgi:hypothetical protein